MKIEQLPSGSYRVRKMYKGKTYTVIFDYKPTQKDAMAAMTAELNKVRAGHIRLTFHSAAEQYIDSRRSVISPSTARGYSTIIRQMSDNFLNILVRDITPMDVQREVNLFSQGHSPKSVRNFHGFISAVLGVFCPDLKLTTSLPQKRKNEPYIPSDDDVRKILAEAAGTQFEIPLLLACYGMRRSEICALRPEDIDGDIVTINKALVQNENAEWIVKPTKTTAGTRTIVIPMELADKIREQGYVYNGHPGKISDYLYRIEKKLGIESFSIHKLRHYFASKMSALHVPEADILKMGGWESDYVMKAVYRHSMMEHDKNAKREASEALMKSLFP